MTSIIIIWGAFGMKLLLVVAVGAMIQYLKDREKYKKIKNGEWSKVVNIGSTKTPEPAIVKTPDISEPITSFIKCFKENPKRFKVTRVSYGGDIGFMTLTDFEKKKSWDFTIGSAFHGVERLYLPKDCGWITEKEKEAILFHLRHYFAVERRERLHAIQRQRLTRIYKERTSV